MRLEKIAKKQWKGKKKLMSSKNLIEHFETLNVFEKKF